MDGPKNNFLAIATPSLDAYSETFIQAQIALLKPVLVLHGGVMPGFANGALIAADGDRREAIRALFQQYGIACVLAQYGPSGVAMMEICRDSNIRLIVHFHGVDISSKKMVNHYAKQYALMFEMAHRIVAVSKTMIFALTQAGCPPEKIWYNPYGANEVFFNVQPAVHSETFVSLGRFVEKKGPLYTLEAFHKFHQKHAQARLIMAGDGPLLEDCKALALSLGLDQHVMFPGVIPHQMVPGLFSKAFGFVQHSLVADDGDSEGLPVSILEAMAASLPIVSTRHAGIPEAVDDGVTGLLVKEKDVDGMAAAFEHLYLQRDKARRMGILGRDRAKAYFSMERYIHRLKEILA